MKSAIEAALRKGTPDKILAFSLTDSGEWVPKSDTGRLKAENASLAAKERLPLCQDCGTAVVFMEIGQEVHLRGDLAQAVDEGIPVIHVDVAGGKARGFDLLRQLKLAGENIRVTNNSWGGGGYSQSLKDAMLALENTAGAPSTINICAAGNSGVNADFTPMYPAAYDNRGIVSVLASDSNDAGASFTNYGYASVDLAAPGVNTYSTEATGTCSLCDPSGYRTLSGTSMASPHVAGVAAAMLSAHPSLTAAQAREMAADKSGSAL